MTASPTTYPDLNRDMSNKVLPPLPGGSSVRIRFQAIDVDLTSKPEYPICLKLLLNNQVHKLLDQIAVGRPLHWDQIPPIDATSTDYVELRAYEVHRFWRKVRIGAVKFQTHQLKHLTTEIKVTDSTGLVPCSVKFTFLLPETVLSAPHTAHRSAAAVIDRSRSILESMGKARDLVDAILKIGGHVSQLSPMAKDTLGICNQAWETLQHQDKCDRLVAELVIGMGHLLPFVDAVTDQAKVLELKTTITNMLHLIEDASRFVVEYKSDGAPVRAIRAFLSSTAQEQVDEFMTRFGALKEDFDRGMITQVVLGMEQAASGVGSLLDDADREILTRLMTPDAGYDPSAGCLEGTRETVQNEIKTWIDGADLSQSLFWLNGLAGCGKSTVARSVCKHLDEIRRLGGAFFCKRDKKHLSEPENVVSTLAANLAFACQPYGAQLVAALRKEPHLTTSALVIRFRGLIINPVEAIGSQPQMKNLVIIVDALDECGTTDSRGQLLTCLFELSQLVPWLKIMLTSRPNEELTRFFEKKGGTMPRYDLFQEDRELVFSDLCFYIRDRLARLMDDDESLSQRNWLEDGTVEQLATRAHGLFIWAQTAFNVICNSMNPGKKIDDILSGESSEDADTQLGSLYTNILVKAMGKGMDDIPIIRCCIMVVIITRIPLNDTALADLLAGRIKLNELRRAIRRLSSVLYRDQSGAVRVVHQSFSDYMVGERCPAEYRIDKHSGNITLATSCLSILLKELRFNICELEDSRLYNREVPTLAARIQETMRPHLQYSCVYWANHLSRTSVFNADSHEHQAVMELLDKFLSRAQILYWIEALSLLERLHASETNLFELMDWMKGSSHKLYVHANELQRFVAAFYLPISQNTPHLYISAVAFGSEQFAFIKTLQTAGFPNVLQLDRGKHLGAISNGWLKVIPHSSPISAAAYSPDGKLVVTSSDRTARAWDTRTGAAIADPLEGHSSSVTCIAFSPDSYHIVTGSEDNTLRVWDLRASADAIHLLEGHSDSVTCATFCPGGDWIASGSSDNTVRVWEALTGAAIFNPLQGHSNSVTCVAFSRDGYRVVSGSEDNTLRVWDLRTGTDTIHLLQGHSNSVICASFSPDDHRIVSASRDNKMLIWDLETGATTPNPLPGHANSVTRAVFASENQHMFLASLENTVRVLDSRTCIVTRNPLEGSSRWATCIVFSPDARRIASASLDKTVWIWDLHNGVAPLKPLRGHSDLVTCIAFSPDGQHLATGSNDNTLRLWDHHIGAGALSPPEGHSDSVLSVAFSPDGHQIVSGSNDKTVRVWNARTGVAIVNPFQGHASSVWCVAFCSDGHRIVSGSYDGIVRICDLSTSTEIIALLEGHSDSATCVAFSCDGQYVVSGSLDNTVRVWEALTCAAIVNPLRGHSNSVTCVAFSPDGYRIVSGSEDNTLRVWDLRAGTDAIHLLEGHSNSVTCAVFSPDGHLIVSGSEDNTLRVWDLRAGTDAIHLLEGHSNPVTCAAFSPDSRRIVSGSEDNTLRVWDVHTGIAALNPLEGHSHWVTAVAFSFDGRHIVSGSEDNTVRVWDASPTTQLLDSLPEDFTSSPAGSYLLSYQLGDLLTHEGWVLDKSARPLFWLPPQLQRSRVDHSMLAIASDPLDHPVSFNFSKFKWGTDWTSVRGSCSNLI